MSTVGTLLGIKSIAVIVGAVVFAVSYIAWVIRKPADQVNQEIDQKVDKDRHEAEDTGRPV